ncbi:hypothetical protein [Spirosoma endbachense]|uniref:Uncharacterized protein n=1 Tax=Spirosoma endbachense TaxID=2666025 RepID=A0A6P1W3D6_9BACT|nr:hypothetical protein [Spirosoma endbachense]QHV98216.1 hypothetical protein GJR95_25865 [Spirosoma endbachense]
MKSKDKQQIADEIRAKVAELEMLIVAAESLGLTVKLSGRTVVNSIFRPETPLTVEIHHYQTQQY